jgi:hypothetical protein
MQSHTLVKYEAYSRDPYICEKGDTGILSNWNTNVYSSLHSLKFYNSTPCLLVCSVVGCTCWDADLTDTISAFDVFSLQAKWLQGPTSRQLAFDLLQ